MLAVIITITDEYQRLALYLYRYGRLLTCTEFVSTIDATCFRSGLNFLLLALESQTLKQNGHVKNWSLFQSDRGGG